MNFISSSQLSAYESNINKIECEHKKSEKLQQEINKETNKLIISHLSKTDLFQKIAHINVKIFSDIFELLYLYRDEIKIDISSFFKKENCKFYLVEIFITNSLYRTLKDLNCFLVISVKYGNVCINKMLQVETLVTPLLEVLPVDQNVVDCRVSATLILPTDEHFFNVILDTVITDISFHFEINKKPKHNSLSKKILEIAKLYNPTFDILEVRKPLLLEYQFLTTITSKEFVKKFIQNCYHRIDLEYFSELGTDSKTRFVLKFSAELEKHTIIFDRASNFIILKSNFETLVRLKNYFCNVDCMQIGDADKFKKDIKKLMSSAKKCEEKEELCSFYIELRRFWTNSYT